jgi:hypothetical protein
MARDKAKDDKFFNCSEEYENDYIANLYGLNKTKVTAFLINYCRNNIIKYTTHHEIYILIKLELGYEIPN